MLAYPCSSQKQAKLIEMSAFDRSAWWRSWSRSVRLLNKEKAQKILGLSDLKLWIKFCRG
jgi:hypothetical protein